jgi:carboxypeptidase Taq
MSINLYKQYKSQLQKIADIKYASAVLQWDQETYLPKKGNDARGRQIATLNELAHELFTKNEIGELLNELNFATILSDEEKRNVELSLEDYNKSKKLPAAFVRQLSEATNKSFHAWIQARKENDFSIFEKPLQQIIDLKKQEAAYFGFENHPYDALLNEYDKGITTKFLDDIFSNLTPELTKILEEINSKQIINNAFLHQHFDKTKQWDFGIKILKAMHFDFDAGRQDISEHPFTTNFCSNDVRITTRIDENDFANMLWSCIHEGGHALYEQGLPAKQYGLPLGEYCSLSIHESQSRLWENNVGRSDFFWQHNYSNLQKTFPIQLENITEKDFYKGINKVQPSLVRTEADEITYHFHVMIRYEIEKNLIDGTIHAKDIPSLWNELYLKKLGITVPNDLVGCLQDVHWSHGSFGYFPTYSLGSMYAAQFFTTYLNENTKSFNDLSQGNYEHLKLWLNQKIHINGRKYNGSDLCKLVSGEHLNPNYFLAYIKYKYSDIYEF